MIADQAVRSLDQLGYLEMEFLCHWLRGGRVSGKYIYEDDQHVDERLVRWGTSHLGYHTFKPVFSRRELFYKDLISNLKFSSLSVDVVVSLL